MKIQKNGVASSFDELSLGKGPEGAWGDNKNLGRGVILVIRKVDVLMSDMERHPTMATRSLGNSEC